MSILEVPKVAIRGISACVPEGIERTVDIPFYSNEEASATIASTGIVEKHVAPDDVTASDLCILSAQTLLRDLDWDPSTVDILCFVTQTPDYINHPDGFVAHKALGLKENCIVVDIFHGCPGWVMSLCTISSLLSLGQFKRALILAGDTLTKMNYKLSHESRPLFGDAGTATGLEYDENASPLAFEMGTDSENGEALIRKKGAYREPFSPDTFSTHFELLQGIRSVEEVDDNMDGMSVFAFGISKPPKSIKTLLTGKGITIEEIDKLILHQANKLIVDKIVKKLKVSEEKAPKGMTLYGNTASASIPLAIVTECREEYENNKLRTVCCGFGTGLSWASAYFETDHIKCPELIIYR